MVSLIDAILDAGSDRPGRNPEFPHAPEGWTVGWALAAARQAGLEPEDEHWEVVRALQEYSNRHRDTAVNLRELHDALDERFHNLGGIRYLYQILPGGPVAQGCYIAGLKPPPGVVDPGFGSVG